MKKKLLLLFGIFFMISVVSYIGVYASQELSKKDEDKKVIATSFYPVHIIVSNLIDGCEDIECVNITSNVEGCLHDYQLTSADMKNLESADVLVINGGGMEHFIENAVSVYDDLRIIDSSENIELLEGTCSHNHGAETGEECETDCTHEHTEECETESVHEHTEKCETESAHEHTEECETDCTHEHTEECETNCTHEHTEKCETESVDEHTEKCETESAHEHTEECETDCTHEHTEECETNCTHEHTEECETNCTHEHTEECETESIHEHTEECETDCTHEHTEECETESTHEHTEESETESAHNHSEEGNAHIWLNTSNYLLQIENVAKCLVEIYPEYKDIIEENKADYSAKVKAVQNEMSELAKSVKGEKVIIFHDAFAYFADETGMNVLETVAIEEESSLSAGVIAEVIDKINDNNVKVLLTEKQFSSTIADSIASETDAKVYVFDSLVSGDEDLNSYINGMRNNIEVLRTVYN